jgi:hypothetical protein
MAVIAAVRVSLERGPSGLGAARQALLEGYALLARGIHDIDQSHPVARKARGRTSG